MPARSLLAAVALAGVLATGLAGVLAGCGSRVSGAPVTPSGQPSGSVNPGGPVSTAPPGGTPAPSAGSPSSPAPSLACRPRIPASALGSTVLTLRNSSNGGTFCVQAGQRVDVYLTGTAGKKWTIIRSDSPALVPVAYGHLTLPVGVTGGVFAARHTGVAHLSSDRQACASKPISCHALAAFRATVIIVTNHT